MVISFICFGEFFITIFQSVEQSSICSMIMSVVATMRLISGTCSCVYPSMKNGNLQ